MVNWGEFTNEVGIAFFRRLNQRVQNKRVRVYTDPQVTHISDVTMTLSKCSPIIDDLDQKQVGKICAALSAQNELKARQLIEAAQTPEARGWCIDTLKAAATLVCTCAPTVVKEATFNLLGC